MNSVRRICLLLFVLLISRFISRADSLFSTSMQEPNSLKSSDTVIYRILDPIDIYPRRVYRINTKQYSRLVKKIRKVYPFAKEAAHELDLYNDKFKNISDPRQKRLYVKKVEKELFARHEKEFKHLTVSEGRYLMLLIDRETKETSYDLIKEIKGSFPAMFWQGIAKIFGNDLKDRYDPLYKHYMIEQIVLMIGKENS